MIQLTGISLVNWHLFAVADMRFSGNTAVLGKNATGKSTLIDLIQAVMTGGSASYHKFNRSAGEGGSRSERTLRSYCLGQTDQAVSLRRSGFTHLVLTFGGAGLERPVSLGLCIDIAENEDAARVTGRYVVSGVAVNSDMLLDRTKDATKPSSWATLKMRLEQACADVGGELFEHQSTSAPKFIREYMRILFTGRRAPDPDRFIKAFIMALSFEDMRSVEDFVCSYLLERNDVDIAELRGSVQRYQQIQSDIAELDRKLAALRPIRAEIERLASILEQEDSAECMRRLADLLDVSKEHFRLLGLRRNKAIEKGTLDGELFRLNDEIVFLTAELESVRAQIATSGVEAKRFQLRTELELEAAEYGRVIGRLKGRHAPVAAALKLLDSKDRMQALGLGLGRLLDDLSRIRDESGPLLPPAWPRNPILMDQLIASAASTAAERLERVTGKRDDSIAQRVAAEGRAADIAARLGQSRQGTVTLNRHVASLMDLLRERGMRPRALCEVLDLSDETWRVAAEALLGRDRETIMVDPDHAEEAVTLLRRERGRFPGCRVANTRKLRSSVGVPASGSLASVFTSDDAIAMSFVISRLGSVRLARSQVELMADGRAVMDDGSYYDGLVVEIRVASDFKIGKVAATLMTGVLEKEFADESAIAKTHLANERLLSDIFERLVRLCSDFGEGDRLETLSIALADSEERKRDLLDRLERVGLLVDPKLDESRKLLDGRIAGLREERETNQKKIGALETELAQLSRVLGDGQAIRGSWWSVKHRLRLFRERVRSQALFQRLRPKYAELRAAKTDAALSQQLEGYLKRLTSDRQGCDAVIRDKVSDYLYSFGVQRPFDANSSIFQHMKPWVEQTIAVLEGNDLVRYRRQADEAAERITFFFRTSFVQEINSRFRDLEREIDDVRQALRSKQLHGEVYSLHALVRPEFRDLYNLARTSETDDKILSLLFSADQVDHPYRAVIEQVERLLRDEQSGFERYQDYRNYYTFELKMKDVDSGHETTYDRRRGVASGAERQVPFYVIIGAALSSIYHGTRRSAELPGLGLAVFDEAFSKMDGQNQRTMLEFYNEIGLQVLIAAPTEKRAVVYENLDSVVDVYRFGNTAEVEVSKIKDRVRDAMREANPDHLTDEALLLRITDLVNDTIPASASSGGTDRDETIH
ncbi:DNA primase [Mesorhizobium tamadayense]|uniref:DNA primase n=1 Tax=Mesorhizobium tamadayense TaxID=425306 RepID=A0A3P3FDY8_9HYPH|nr:SbcC/MukB-like Walker B domain-containing protein [Mesorhizobium tamadayense]RRH96900.1 DNA primase [Mesorhizobium tamadayense]